MPIDPDQTCAVKLADVRLACTLWCRCTCRQADDGHCFICGKSEREHRTAAAAGPPIG